MHNIIVRNALRLVVLSATFVLSVSLPVSAQTAEGSPPAPRAVDVGVEPADVSTEAADVPVPPIVPTIEVEAAIELSGLAFGSSFGVGRILGENVVLMGSAAFSASLDASPFQSDQYAVSGRLALKVYARTPRARAVTPTVVTSVTYDTTFAPSLDSLATLGGFRSHRVGGEVHCGLTYFVTESVGLQVRAGVAVRRSVGDVPALPIWLVASSTELGVTIRY